MCTLTRIPMLIALALCCVLPVSAHAILLSATPESESTVSGPEVRVRLQFNSRIDGKRSRLSLVLPEAPERLLATSQPTAAIVASDIKNLPPGTYVLRWQVLAEDGHITRGELPFRVK